MIITTKQMKIIRRNKKTLQKSIQSKEMADECDTTKEQQVYYYFNIKIIDNQKLISIKAINQKKQMIIVINHTIELEHSKKKQKNSKD